MNSIAFYLITIACLVSIACILPGVFLVLRGVALMSDAISHAILLGIVIMFLCIHRLESAWLLVGASLAGLLTVLCTEALIQTQRLKKDAAIGLVFPLFFSIGIILICLYARNVHLDMDMVLLGELAFAPFNRLVINGIDLGPYALWIMSSIVLLNLLFVCCFYKELQLIIFDQDFAYTLGISSSLLYYSLMALTSVTAVGAFDAVGSIVVVALMVTPAATAYLITEQIFHMLIVSIAIGILSSTSGYLMASYFDVSIAGSIATMTGVIFMGVLVGSLSKNLLAYCWYKIDKKKDLSLEVFLTALFTKSGNDNIFEKHDLSLVRQRLGWKGYFFRRIMQQALAEDYIFCHQGYIILTERGYAYAKKVLVTMAL